MPRTTIQVSQARKVAEWIATGRARELRLAAGLTLADIGRDCEVDPAAVLKWERGNRTPRGRNIGSYFRVLASLEAVVADRS